MKKLILAAALIGFASTTYAVSTKDCPEKISITYEAVTPSTEQNVIRALENMGMDESSLEEVMPWLKAVEKAKFFEFQEVELSLMTTKNGVCTYAKEGQKLNGDNETRLFTRDGRDILRVSLQMGKQNVWIYHNVNSYDSKTLDVSPLSGKVLGYFDHGGPRVQVGWAEDVAITVIEK